MAKFLLLSLAGDGLGLALHLKQKRHQVAVWIKERHYRQSYEGLIPKVIRWEDYLDKDTVVFFDSTGGGKTADRLKARGHKVFLGSTFADQIEIDRDTGLTFMKEVGIKLPRSENFFNWQEGRDYAKSRDTRLVFKPSGEISKEDTGIGSYVGYDAEDMVEMLYYFETKAKGLPPEFELQDFVEGGVAISTEGWFNGEDWITPFNHTVERKQLMDKNLGPSGGCAFNAVWNAGQTNHIIEEGIKLMGPILREHEYIGPIDLNTIVNEQGVWGLEFTPRFGYDALPSFLELYQGDIGELIAKMAGGEKPKEMVLKEGFASGLRVTIPPYPSDEFTHEGGVPIRGFERSDRTHLYFYDVMLNDRNLPVSSPGYGAIVAITGHGNTIQEAFSGPYALAQKARIPDKQYRNDAVETLGSDYGKWNELVSAHHNIAKEVGGNA